jgi:TolB protein
MEETYTGTGLIGYTEHRTDLPGGRASNIFTSRAFVVQPDGAGRRELVPQLISKANTWTQFSGWSPDGKQAIINCGWESSENAAREEEQKTFLLEPGHWLLDSWLVNIDNGQAVNVTSVNRVSHYNTGLFFWSDNTRRVGFTALIDGELRPYCMDLDGSNKRDLSQQSGFTYGFNVSPDGKRIAYHQSYQVYLADEDGSNAKRIETGHPFGFCPAWSPDGKWVVFLSGEQYNCHPHLIERDGTGLRKLADRCGYNGVMLHLDVPDFHGGSSDLPAWSPDSKWVYYTSRVGEAIEFMRVSLDGKVEQLSESGRGIIHYHPKVSPDGRRVVFGSNRDGIRQLWLAGADGSNATRLTDVKKGHAAMHAYWQPTCRKIIL